MQTRPGHPRHSVRWILWTPPSAPAPGARPRRYRPRRTGLAALAGLAGAAALVLAWTPPATAGELALGGAGADYDGAIRGVDRQTAALPFVYYEGERFSVIFTQASWHLVQRGDFRLSAVAAGRFDGYEAGDSPWLAGMQTRDPALDVGLEAAWGNLSLAVTGDASGTHRGTEATLSYAHGMERGRFQLQVIPGVRWQSRQLSGYYFGVEPGEAATLRIDGQPWARPAYAPGQAVVPRLGTLALYRFSPRWSAIAGAEVSWLPGTVTDSPIVGRSTQWGVFAGVAWHLD